LRIPDNPLFFDSTNLAGVAIECELSDLRKRCTYLSGKEIKEEVGDILSNQAKYFNTEVSGPWCIEQEKMQNIPAKS